MNDEREQPWLTLASEVIEALSEARTRRQPLDQASLARILAERPQLIALLQKPVGAAEGKPQSKSIKYEELEAKYKELFDDFRHLEGVSDELEEAFKGLISILTNLAETPSDPVLTPVLKSIRQSMRHKAVSSRINSSALQLKNILFQLDAGRYEELTRDDIEPASESVEDRVRDILIELLHDLSAFEQPDIQKRAKILIRRIASEFTLEDFKTFVREIQDIIFSIKEFVRRERKELYWFSQELISHLEATDKDLSATLERSCEHLGGLEADFHNHVARDMKEIERVLDLENVSLQTIRARVFAQIATIRERFQKKRDEDQARLRQLEEEKTRVEQRFNEIHVRYQQFTEKSQAMLEEMERFREASLRDGLTQVYNRRAYDTQITHALDELAAGRLGSFGLIVFDIDHFKDFNTMYGHRAGDKILQHVAAITSETLRKLDFVARYGGDEFTVILPEVDLDGAVSIAEKIHLAVTNVEFKIYRDQDTTVRVGLSMGVGLGRPNDTPASVFQRVDQALYKAKGNGRNKIQTEESVPRG